MAEEKRKPGRPPGSKNKTSSTTKTTSKSKTSSGKTTSSKSSTKNSKSSTKSSSRKSTAKTSADMKPKIGSRVRDEIWAIILIAVGAFLIIALQTEAAGAFGAILHEFFLGCFGFMAIILPYYLIVYGLLLLLNKAAHVTGKSAFLILTLYLMIVLLNSARFIDTESFSFSPQYLISVFDLGVEKLNGGFVGMLLGTLIVKAIGRPGLYLFTIVVIIILLLVILNTPVSQFLEKMKIKRHERQVERMEAYEEAQRLAAEEAERLSKEKEAAAKVEAARMKASELAKPVPEEVKAVKIKEDYRREDIRINIPKYEEDTHESTYIPGKMSEGQKNIMNLMKDEELFGSREVESDSEIKYGLDESAPVPSGFGLDGDIVNTGLGLDYDESDDNLTIEKDNDVVFKSGLNPVKADPMKVAAKAAEVQGHAAYETEQRLTKKEAREAMLTQEELNLSNEPRVKPYEFPPITLLNKPPASSKQGANSSVLRDKAIKLEETLRSFNVDARVINVTQGPSVTQYEVQPALGVKVSSIVKLADDIALNLEAKNIRIEAPIPGKAAVGIEIENDTRSMVTLREVLGSQVFKNSSSKISFALGRDIYGNDIVGDIKEMPHLLVAGSTGSGKSVCINSIILSILYKAKPEDVKLVLIDPKAVELGNYNGIPHLLIPVVTKPEKAAAALNWAVAEMTERYNKFADANVRDLKSYNDVMQKLEQPEGMMPQIVIIIDELADLMMSAPSQVEESITRLAQMARAAGMHLIVATQRPSVDVVTGLIKSNIPSRIAFKVASQIDSRTILDGAGAEKLAGKGDMLYAPNGEDRRRVQGVFVSNDEINAVIDFVKAQGGTAEYASDVINRIENTASGAPSGLDDDGDELLPEVIELVVTSGQASASMLQRRFRIGYNRAARIIDMLEARGIIGPPDGSRPRQVLMTETELYALQGELTNNEDFEEEL